MPVFDNGVEVLFKVSPGHRKLLLYAWKFHDLKRNTDHLHLTIDADGDIRAYKACRDPVLSKVAAYFSSSTVGHSRS